MSDLHIFLTEAATSPRTTQAFMLLGAFSAFLDSTVNRPLDVATSFKSFAAIYLATIFHVCINTILYLGLLWGISATQFDGLRLILQICKLGILMYLSGHLTTLIFGVIASCQERINGISH